jgi:transposase
LGTVGHCWTIFIVPFGTRGCRPKGSLYRRNRNPVAAVQTQPRRLPTSVPTAPQCSSFIRSGSATPVVHSGGNAKAQPSRAFLLSLLPLIAVTFEAGRDGFWLARWLRARGIEAHVIHASSVAVSREHRRAKTDRLDTELLKRAFLGWLRGERDHCKMVAIPTIEDEDAKRPNRERECLVGEQSRIINRMKATLSRLGIRGFNPKLKKAAERLEGLRTPEGEAVPPNTLAELHRDMERRRLLRDQIRQIESTRLDRLDQAAGEGAHAMVRLLARVMGIGIETADMLVHEVLSRNLRDRRAIARYDDVRKRREPCNVRRIFGPRARQRVSG